jgi:hypothetical protein
MNAQRGRATEQASAKNTMAQRAARDLIVYQQIASMGIAAAILARAPAWRVRLPNAGADTMVNAGRLLQRPIRTMNARTPIAMVPALVNPRKV